MQITTENYFSKEANQEYMGSTQYKKFLKCEAEAMAELSGAWVQEEKDAFIQGRYVHAFNEGKLDQFKARNPQLFKKDGSLYAPYVICETVIESIKSDDLFMDALSGEKEVIFTAEMFGTKWKILIDSYFKKLQRFGDLKVLKSLDDKFWNKDLHIYETCFEAYGYYDQIAIYAEVERLANNRDTHFEPFIAVATKEKYPDKAIISFNSDLETHSEFIERRLINIERNVERILMVKAGIEEPIRCGSCDYCKSTKRLTGTTHYTKLEQLY